MVSVNLGSLTGARRGVPPAGNVRRRRRTLALRDLEAESRRRARRGLPIVDDEDDADGTGEAPVEHATSHLPSSRSTCRGGPRPCPLVSCRYHLYLDVDPTNGSLKLNFPDLQPWELPCSCALDVADEGGVTLDVVGAHLGLTRERARQLERVAIGRILDALERPKSSSR